MPNYNYVRMQEELREERVRIALQILYQGAGKQEPSANT